MSTKLHRFDFGSLRDFRSPITVEHIPEAIEEEVLPSPPPPTFSVGELEAARSDARQAGFAEGFEAGMARAAEQAEAQRHTVDTTILQLGNTLHTLRHEYHHVLRSESEALTELVLMIAHKVTGIMLETHGGEAVASMVRACLAAIFSKPRLTVELHPDAFEQTINRIESLLHTSGFEGELQFRANAALGMHDTVLDWGTGQASRSTAALWKEIETLLSAMPLDIALPVIADTLLTSVPENAAALDASAESIPPTV